MTPNADPTRSSAPRPETEPMFVALVGLMGDISEDCWCAGWMAGFERDLWALVVGDLDTYGLCNAAYLAGRLAALRAVAEMGDIWARWDETEQRPVPVALESWKAEYAAATPETNDDLPSSTQGGS